MSLVGPATPPAPGDDFFVGIYIDAMDYPGYIYNGGVPTLKSAQIGIVYDPAVFTPLQTVPPPPPPKWFFNLNQMFVDYAATPAANLPAPGDLRFVYYTTFAPGMDPTFYGFENGVTPIKLWDLKFHYIGGTGTIDFGTISTMVKVSPDLAGGTLKELETITTAWDNAVYAPTFASYTDLGGGGGANTWTNNTGDGMWMTDGNWSMGHVPMGTEDVEIPDVAKGAPVVIMGDALVGGMLHVSPGAILVVDPLSSLTTTGLFTNDGMFMIESETAGGYGGSFIDMGGVAGGGTFEYDRGILCSGTLPGVSDPLGWHYLSAPIDGFTTDDLPDYFVNAWDQGTGTWMQYSMDPIAFPCTPWPTTPLTAMDAWSINFDMGYPEPACPGSPAGTGVFAEFTGPAPAVHTGPYAMPLGYGAAGYEMWNLVGNPYPSGLDMSTISWGPSTVAGAAYYDGCGGGYVYWTPAIGPYIMAPTLGFFVETTGADVLSVDNSNRAIGADWFWKDEVPNLLILEATGNERSDKLYVRFMDNVTPGFDMNGDFHKLFATTEGLPQIYTVAGSDKLAINALPETNAVPMGFVANGSGTYTIEAIETSDFSTVILEDKVTGETTDLLAGSYTFEYTEGAAEDRFVIHFAPLGIGENGAGTASIWSSDHTIYVQTSTTARGDIVVYNMMGQEVVRTDIAPGLNTLPMNEVNTYYVVKVLTSDKAVTGKVYIK